VIVGEFTTLVNPGPAVPPGFTTAHGITRTELDRAPAFGAVLGPLLDLCQGSVLVVHDLPSVREFLAAELTRLGVRLPVLPVVSTLTAVQQAIRLPNYRLATVARAFGVDAPAASALTSARTIARLVTTLVGAHGFTFAAPPQVPVLPRYAGTTALAPRDVSAGEQAGWMADVVDRVPAGRDSTVIRTYLDLLAAAVADQHLSPGEVSALAALATEAGVTDDAVRAVHRRFVGALRQVAEGDGVVTAAEERELRQIASALGVPDVVADLRTTGEGQRPMRVLVLGTTADADRLRARVLDEGVQLAQRLTTSVTHLVHDRRVPAGEPRLSRARELGVVVLDLAAAPAALGFEAAAERTEIVAPVRAPIRPAAPALRQASRPLLLIGGRVLLAVGLFVLFVVVVGMFGGLALAGGIVFALVGLGLVFGGWWLAEDGRPVAR
jgi:DNA polymerase-3 subunit epsilon